MIFKERYNFLKRCKNNSFCGKKKYFCENLKRMFTIKTEPLPAVLGIGNALVDIMTVIDNDSILRNFNLPRGSMTLVDDVLSKKIYEATHSGQHAITTGGSAANTIHSLSCLGGNCGYLGKIGDDRLGEIFREEFEKKSIRTHFFLSDKETGRVVAMVSPDSERTMATYLGAAADLIPEDLTREIFKDYSVLYIEGYLVQNHELIETAIKLARSERCRIALDLSSYNVVNEHLSFLQGLLKDHVDILFANEEEALAFTGKNPENAVEDIASICEMAIVKIGKEGSLIRSGEQFIRINPVPASAIDTTGAGDAYAAGFLYGLTKGLDLRQCGNIAALVSGRVVEVMGAKIPEASWPQLNKEVKKLIN